MHIKDLHPANFRGADFLTPTSSTQEGRNSIAHNYPDQLMRYVEDNGALPPTFSLPAIIHGENLPAKLNRLRSALMRPGPGVLKHPIFGSVFVMVDQTYTINHTQRNSGVIEFDLKFITTGAPVMPGLMTGIAAVVSQISASAISKAFDAFKENYGPPALPFSSAIIAENISRVAGVITSVFGQVSGPSRQIQSKSGVFTKNMSLSNDLWFEAFRAPIDDETIPNAKLVSGFNAIRLEAQSVIEVSAKIQPSTRDLALRKTSLQAIGEYTELAAFISLAESMASQDYVTGDQVDNDELLLTTGFLELQERSLPAEQHADMFNVYIATSDILERAVVRLPRLTTINAHDTPASVLSYQLYEADGLNHSEISGKSKTLVDLNLNQNPSIFGADTSIVTRVN